MTLIYHTVNKTTDYNPANKHFVFLVNLDKKEEVKVLIIDSFDIEYTYKGHLFQDNKELSYFMVNDMFEDENGDTIMVFKDLVEAFVMRYGNNSSEFKFKLINTYNNFSNDIKTNGVLLLEAFFDFFKKIIKAV